MVSVKTPLPGTGQTAQTTTNFYSNMGRLTGVLNPDLTTSTNEYFVTGDLKKTYGSRTYQVEYTYDPQGRMKTMKTWRDVNNSATIATTTWNYDTRRGWLTSKTYDDGKGPSYTYFPSGRLNTRVWYRGVTTTYAYNNFGDLYTVSYSDGTTPQITYTYNRFGRKATSLRNSITTTYSYNDASQLTGESYSGGSLNGRSVVYGFDSYLRKNSATVPGYITNSYTFDTASRLSTVGDGFNSAAYTYLANSPLISQILFKTNTTTRMTTAKSYDLLNRLLSISSAPAAAGQLVMSSGYVYNDANQRTKLMQNGDAFWNYDYDALGQVKSGKKYWANNSPVPGEQFEYVYDSIGNRTSVKMGGDENGLNLRSATYTPNSLNEYSSRSNPAAIDVIGISSVGATVSVNTDSTGVYRKNQYFRKELSVSNNTYPSVSTVATSGGSSTTVSGNVFVPPATESYTHDDDGNVTVDGRWNLTWDGENRLIQVESKTGFRTGSQRKLTFEYDCQGRRIRLKIYVGGSSTASTDVKFLYDGWNLLAELDGANSDTVLKSYIWGTDLSGTMQGAGGVGGLIAVRTNNIAYFAAYDGNGNVVGLVDGNAGTAAANYEYDPFGQTIRATGALAKVNPFRFSSKYTDEETDFLYYGYRFYNPSSGRWLSRDPITEKGGFNLYSFNNNEPIFRTDYLGEKIQCLCPETYFLRLGIKKDMFNKSGSIYSANKNFKLSHFDGQGDAEIVWRMLYTDHLFKIKDRAVWNLRRHVAAKSTIAANAAAAKFSWRQEDGGPDVLNHTDPNHPKFGDDPEGFFNSINNSGTELRCKIATTYVFESGNHLESMGTRDNDLVFIPGDWPYLDNAAQTISPSQWDRGLEGENLIHVSGESFWGHPSGVKTEAEWFTIIKNWKSKDGQGGEPKWGNHGDNGKPIIKYPKIWLD